MMEPAHEVIAPEQPESSSGRRWGKRLVMAGLVLVLILGAGTWIAGALTKSAMRKQYPPPGQMVEVGGHKMHINCMGQGSPTVILAAGLDDFSIFWSLVQPDVAKFTRACSFDRAGLGWSEPSPRPRTLENMTEELHTLLVNAGLEEPYVMVGHSFGGAQTTMYADRYPDEVAGLVLVDAAPNELFDRIPTWRGLIQQKIGLYRTLALLDTLGLLPFASANIPNRGLPEVALAQYRAIAASTGYFQTAVAENEAFEKNLSEARAAHVALGATPLIVISRGYWDPIPGLSDAENREAWRAWREMQSELPGLASDSRFTVAAQSEHHIQLQQPQIVIGAIASIVVDARR